ncbi:glycosyltransferase family 2 protein [Dethiothermospora halolimnae]|uniref:glycosyltransferase family 2 protein n=1 Tax=Dethiothermospora halolimnae TaxID=3114390 RepID=UPI003CCC3F8F
MENNKIVCVIPTYNEELYIEDTIKGLKKTNLIDSIVVVDDGSTDETINLVEKMDVKLIKLNKNYGKGYAIKKALKAIDFDLLVLVDGDIGVTSYDIKKLIIPVKAGYTDIAIGRFGKPKKRGGFGLVKALAKYGVFTLTKHKLNCSLCGQRVYKKDAIKNIKYIPNKYGVEIAMTVSALREGYKIDEIDVNMTHRETERNISGFIHRGKQFINILKTLMVLIYRGE